MRVHITADGDATILRDRKDDYLSIDMSHAAMEADYPRTRQRAAAHVGWLSDALRASGGPSLGGDHPGALDPRYFHVVWLVRNGPQAAAVDRALGLDPLLPWYARVAALGHGRPLAMSSEAALDAARVAGPAPLQPRVEAGDLPGLAVDAPATVTPDDFAPVPVHGSLVILDAERIVIRRAEPDLGTLHLHFPRAGFTVPAAS